jgi:heparan-alpha-glucosaminide N-acetyltransferase
MIFVNAGGGGYALLDHSPWNGLQLADLLFPWFIWMMGFSMAISFESLRKRNASRRDTFEKVIVRSLKLAFLGLMTSNFELPFNQLRIPGVLMRFAVSYFFVSMIVMFVPKNVKAESSPNFQKYKVILWHRNEIIVILLIIGLWLGITFGMPVPGCPTGYIGPGGIGDYGLYPNCTGGAAGYIDR